MNEVSIDHECSVARCIALHHESCLLCCVMFIHSSMHPGLSMAEATSSIGRTRSCSESYFGTLRNLKIPLLQDGG